MKKRLFITLILVLVLSLLCVYFVNNYESHLDYPSTGAILSDYPEGEMVSVSGEVMGVYIDGSEIFDNYHGEKVIFIVKSSSNVSIGDNVAVLGILGSSYEITASKIIVSEKWMTDFVYLRSGLAFFIIVFIFYRYWRFDIKNREFMEKIKKMPDWLTHIPVAWTACKILGFKYRQFDGEGTSIAMLGSIIPDIIKISVPLESLGIIDVWDYIMPVHMPVGSLIIAGIISLFFRDKKMVFIFLVFGIVTHFSLDLLLTYVSGGIYLFYPFSWDTYQLRLISTVDYNITILAILAALFVYLLSYYMERGHAKAH